MQKSHGTPAKRITFVDKQKEVVRMRKRITLNCVMIQQLCVNMNTNCR